MAVDSEVKRRSALSAGQYAQETPVIADGAAFTQADRQFTTHTYTGVLAGGPVVAEAFDRRPLKGVGV